MLLLLLLLSGMDDNKKKVKTLTDENGLFDPAVQAL